MNYDFENETLTANDVEDYLKKDVDGLFHRYLILKEENKNLKEENKNLKEEISLLKGDIKYLTDFVENNGLEIFLFEPDLSKKFLKFTQEEKEELKLKKENMHGFAKSEKTIPMPSEDEIYKIYKDMTDKNLELLANTIKNTKPDKN